MSQPLSDVFITNLDRLRAARGLSWSSLARRAGVSRQSIQLYRSQGIAPRLDSLMRLASALDVTIDAFVAGATVEPTAVMRPRAPRTAEAFAERDRQRARRSANARAGLCSQCSEPVLAAYSMCAEHLRRNRKRTKSPEPAHLDSTEAEVSRG